MLEILLLIAVAAIAAGAYRQKRLDDRIDRMLDRMYSESVYDEFYGGDDVPDQDDSASAGGTVRD